jgi:hypothetical protein
MQKINPKTQAVVDAFMDVDAPEGIRARRRAELQEKRPKLYSALKELVDALYDNQQPHTQVDGQK